MAWRVLDYVQVGAADAAGFHLDEHIAGRSEDGARTALDLDSLGPGEYDGANSARYGQVVTDSAAFRYTAFPVRSRRLSSEGRHDTAFRGTIG
jgi:hypothetical protein